MNKPIEKSAKTVKHLFSDFMEGDFFGLSAEISFYLLSTFFPMILLVFTVASAISLNYTDAMLKALSALPDKASKLIIKMLISRSRSGIVIAITSFLSMTTMSGFILTVEKGLNRFYSLPRRQGLIKSRAIAFIFAFFIFISIISSFGLVIFGRIIGIFIYSTAHIRLLTFWNVSRYLLVLIFIVLVISALYKALPTIKLKISEVLPGAVLATVAWYMASVIFAIYVNNFPQYEIIYGSLAGVVCLIVWVYITGVIILGGAKINALVYKSKMRKKE